MASRYYSEFPERKLGRASSPAPASKDKPGAEAKPRAVEEHTANWPKIGPVWGTSFNRTTKAAVVKTRASKHGID